MMQSESYPLPPEPQQPEPSTGFFPALFDFGFEYFITPIIIRTVYGMAFVVLLLTWLIFVIAGFVSSSLLGSLALLLGGLAVIVCLALVRMTLEFYLSVVRMSEEIHRGLPPV